MAATSPAVRVALPSDRVDWDDHVLRRCDGHLLGTWGWGDVRARHGWEVVRLIAEREGVIEGVLWLQLRRAGPGRAAAFAYAPRGPHVQDVVAGADAAASLVEAARDVARRHRALVLKLDPEWSDTDPAVTRLLRRCRLRANWYDVQHRKTYLVDLDGGRDAVFGRLKESTRRNIRRADRAGVEVTVTAAGEHGASAEIDTLHALFLESAHRNSFTARAVEYFHDLMDCLSASCPIAVLVARHEGRPVSAMLAVAAGSRLVYLYGGNTVEPGGVPSAYGLQWAAILWGLDHGCRAYDMWGVPNHEDASQPGFGYFEFKLRWNGRIERHIRCQDAHLWPLGALPSLVERAALRGRPLLT